MAQRLARARRPGRAGRAPPELDGSAPRRPAPRARAPAGSSPARRAGSASSAPGEGTRPLGDRVKQALFAILEPTIRGRPFLDLFAGQRRGGHRGPVARRLRRPCSSSRDRQAVRAIERNLEATGLAGPPAVVSDRKVGGWLARAAGRRRRSPGRRRAVRGDPRRPALRRARRARRERSTGIADAGRGRHPRRGRRRGREALLEDAPPTRIGCYDRSARSASARRPDLLSLGGRDRVTRGCLMRIALYPGSFDPVTNGHLDVLSRALAVFDQVVVAVLENPRKTPLLPLETRVVVLETGDPRRRHRPDHATVVHVRRPDRRGRAGPRRALDRPRPARDLGLRGRRASSPRNNRVLADDIDTVFFMTAVEYGYVSSSLVKEIALFGGDVSIDGPARRGHRAAHAEPLAGAPALRPRARAIIAPRWTSCSCSNGSSRRSRPAPACPGRARSSSTRTPSSTSSTSSASPCPRRSTPRSGSTPRASGSSRRPTRKSARIAARAQEQAAYLIGERGLTEAARGRGPADRRRGPARGGRRPPRRGRVRGRDPRGARGRGAQGARRDREGHRRPRHAPGRAPRRRPAGRGAGDAAADDERFRDDGDDDMAEGRRGLAVDRRGRGDPARRGRGPDRPAMTAPAPLVYPLAGLLAEPVRDGAPVRDPRRDDPAPGRPAARRAARGHGANHRARTAACSSTRRSPRRSPGRARAASGTSRSR